ncbi:MAG: geranylgeranylglycerol-phosphate geranylgeranyltransferase [candidate division Zixibacteria bacterium]|nr:geranylgeranylglycerol-phosphate geranylgeranyltransferase [candidate division Zixibacteria bacterium]
MSNFLDALKLVRTVNCFLAMVGVYIGAYMAWVEPVYYSPVVTAMAAFFVCAAGNILNDVADIEIDRVNRPERVLVRGTISRTRAINMTVVFALTAVVLALAVNITVTIVVVVALGLLLLYNLRLKKIPVLGNITVAVLSALTFLTGGWAVNHSWVFDLPGPLIPAVFAFFFHLVREILKDVEDIEGDRRAGVETLPQIIGVSRSLLIAIGLFFILVVLTYIPILTGWFGRAYEIITVYIVDLPLLLLLILVWGNPSPRMLRSGSYALKAGMALGLLALLLA